MLSRWLGNGDGSSFGRTTSVAILGRGTSGGGRTGFGAGAASGICEAVWELSPTSRSNSSLEIPLEGNACGTSYVLGFDCAIKALQNNVSKIADELSVALDMRTNSNTCILHVATVPVVRPWTARIEMRLSCTIESDGDEESADDGTVSRCLKNQLALVDSEVKIAFFNTIVTSGKPCPLEQQSL